MIRILINGANGKMGKTTVAAIAHEKDLELVGTVTRGDDLTKKIIDTRADVVIDFTTPESVFENTQTIIAANARPVIGTTGLTPEQITTLKKSCAEKKLGGVIAPNFSITANLMMHFAEIAAHYFSYTEIIEYHHPQKKDKPSGTAKKTVQMMGDANAELKNTTIHSVRMPGYFSKQSVLFGSAGETLTIQHESIDRFSMMSGVFLCCRKVMVMQEMIYGIDAMLLV